MGTTEILITAGVVAVLASIAGGGLKGFGVEVPLLASLKRQAALLVVGVALLGLGLYKAQDNGPAKAAAEPGQQAATNAAQDANTLAAAVPPPKETPPAAAPAEARPDVPNIVGLSFPAARAFLMQNSWAPVNQGNPMANDRLGFRVQEVFETGFGEAVSCSGTGMAPCLFRYKNPGGFVLEVSTVGEELKTARVEGTNLIDCSERPKPEACVW